MIAKHKTIHILLINVHLDCRGGVGVGVGMGGGCSSNRNASRDESVETGDEAVETIEAGINTTIMLKLCLVEARVLIFRCGSQINRDDNQGLLVHITSLVTK